MLEKSVLQQAKQDGIPMKYVYVPDYATQSKIVSGHVTPGYISSPAPMGVGDYGLMNQSGHVITYNYTTGSFMAAVNLTNLADFYLPDNAPQSVSLQLNAVLNNVALIGNASYSFWTQNVYFYESKDKYHPVPGQCVELHFNYSYPRHYT
ncbi:Peptidase A5, thermopsin, partial [mine drainage metagenome]